MAKSETRRPTDAELEILRVLWDRGPCTVRDVLDELSRTRDIGYTTVLKLMQIMTEKSLVARDESNRSHVYRACHKQGQTQRQLVDDLMQRAFGGAADKLVMQALQLKKVSVDDMAKIRQLLDDLEE